MARNFFGFLAQNKPVWVSGKPTNIPGANWLKEQYSHDQSRLSTGHGVGVLVWDEHSDWKLLAHLCSSNGNITLSRGGIMAVTELTTSCRLTVDVYRRCDRLWIMWPLTLLLNKIYAKHDAYAQRQADFNGGQCRCKQRAHGLYTQNFSQL